MSFSQSKKHSLAAAVGPYAAQPGARNKVTMNRIPFRFRFSWIKLSQFPYDPDSADPKPFSVFHSTFWDFLHMPPAQGSRRRCTRTPSGRIGVLGIRRAEKHQPVHRLRLRFEQVGQAWAGCEPLFVAHNAQPPSQSVIPVEFLRKTGLLDESGIRQVDKLRVTAELPAFRGVLVHSPLFSPRGEAKCVRSPSVQGKRRSARGGVLGQYVEPR